MAITNNTIKDDQYVTIDDEFEQIRISLGMYIAKLGTEGAMHLLKELVNNEFDECVNPNAMDTKFDVVFDEVEQSFSCVDYSRGIPFENMVDVCTKKHSSTKFDRNDEKMKDQAGRNGVGLVVAAACSTYMSMTSYRGKQAKTIEFIDGKLEEGPIQTLKKEQHGLAVKVIPSEKYLKGKVCIETHMVQDYLRRMAYIMRDDIVIHYYEFEKGMPNKKYKNRTPSTTITYKRKGLSANVEFLSSTLAFKPIEVSSISDQFDLELAFSYDSEAEETIVNSYCNYIATTEGGYHEMVAQRAICDYFCREAKKLDPNSKYEVTFDDCRKGLVYVINCKHKDPSYEGQHKTRVSNDDVRMEGKKMLSQALAEYFSANNALLRRVIKYLRAVAKVRLEAHKIKTKVMKKQTTFLDENDIPMFYGLANRNFNGYTELFITEGDSAAVSADTARNSKYQAIFGVMGVVSNIYGKSPEQVVHSSKVFTNLVNVLGCGIGKDFDITKLRYDKIIIMSDADADGSNITSLILLFFFQCLPELIIRGKVYKALPPLYLLDEKSVKSFYKGSIYIYSREEYYEVINKIIANNSDMMFPEDDKPLPKKKYLQWLRLNSEYTMELEHLVARKACNPFIIEFVCYAKLATAVDKDEKRFKKILEKNYPEMTYDIATKTFSGSHEKEENSLIVDEVFWKAAVKFMKILAENPSLYVMVRNKNDKVDEFKQYTIGEFLFLMGKMYKVKLQQRYKGIGEMRADVIFKTALNPKIRKLLRFNIDNMDSTQEIFKLLHAKTSEMRQERRQLLADNSISYMDLDN